MAVGSGLLLQALSSCSPLNIYKTSVAENKISVPVSLFEKTDFQIIKADNFASDIVIRKEKNGNYSALLLRCTHADNPLTSIGNSFVCNLHGSRFDKDGNVTKGPAEQSLKKFNTQLVADQIIISLT